MASVFPILFVGVIVVALMFLSFLFTPKGPNQVVIRTFLMLTLACCYIMWMITYLAQLNPLVSPVRKAKA